MPLLQPTVVAFSSALTDASWARYHDEAPAAGICSACMGQFETRWYCLSAPIVIIGRISRWAQGSALWLRTAIRLLSAS